VKARWEDLKGGVCGKTDSFLSHLMLQKLDGICILVQNRVLSV
jgi:hypothetical protein